MPSNRRFKATVLFIALAFIIIIYVTSAPQRTRESPFYTSTSDALSQREHEEADPHGIPADDAAVQKSLREAADAAKKVAEKKAMNFHGEEEKQKADLADFGKKKAEEVKAKIDMDKAISESDSQKVVGADSKNEEEAKAKEELKYILKRSPIVIFSKTYCPHSKQAKNILLGKYKINPPPFVVELDEHEQGPALQEQLGEITGRRTVPNVLVGGMSIGGGDDIQEMHSSGKLKGRIQELLGGRGVTITAVE